jgi:hypothetical protein
MPFEFQCSGDRGITGGEIIRIREQIRLYTIRSCSPKGEDLSSPWTPIKRREDSDLRVSLGFLNTSEDRIAKFCSTCGTAKIPRADPC